jgi:hypothetical protein
MDPIANPYAPGAGSPPPAMAGREPFIIKMKIAMSRIKVGKPAKSSLLIGLRGAGKTVLLDKIKEVAEGMSLQTMRIESPESKSLPALLAPQLRLALLKLSRIDKAKDLAKRALQGLAGFVTALKLTYNDIEVGLDYKPEPGLADNGDLESDLIDLLEITGRAAKKADTALIIFIDELQYVEEKQLGALITALHRCAQQQLPLMMIGAGLPQLRGKMGNAKSYAERLFDFAVVGPLTRESAEDALTQPAAELNVKFQKEALNLIFEKTQGYPYFIQEWGKHTWDIATDSPITKSDAIKATQETIAALDESFFRVRFDRLKPSEKIYLRAMATLGDGPHRSGDISDVLGKDVTNLAPVRASLISKGMIWSPNHGETAFTVPLFDQFMRRIMPED